MRKELFLSVVLNCDIGFIRHKGGKRGIIGQFMYDDSEHLDRLIDMGNEIEEIKEFIELCGSTPLGTYETLGKGHKHSYKLLKFLVEKSISKHIESYNISVFNPSIKSLLKDMGYKLHEDWTVNIPPYNGSNHTDDFVNYYIKHFNPTYGNLDINNPLSWGIKEWIPIKSGENFKRSCFDFVYEIKADKDVTVYFFSCGLKIGEVSLSKNIPYKINIPLFLLFYSQLTIELSEKCNLYHTAFVLFQRLRQLMYSIYNNKKLMVNNHFLFMNGLIGRRNSPKNGL